MSFCVRLLARSHSSEPRAGRCRHARRATNASTVPASSRRVQLARNVRLAQRALGVRRGGGAHVRFGFAGELLLLLPFMQRELHLVGGRGLAWLLLLLPPSLQ